MLFRALLMTAMIFFTFNANAQDFRYEVSVSKMAGANTVNVDFQGVLPPASTANRIFLETINTAALAFNNGDILGTMFHNDDYVRAAGFRAQVIRSANTGEITDF
jgi:hypothetical protein